MMAWPQLVGLGARAVRGPVSGARRLLPMAVLSCVSTSDVGESARACAAGSDIERALSAVVVVDSRLAEGTLRCSGVAIARNLVATQLSCVHRPSEVGDLDLEAARAPTLFYPSLDRATGCDSSRGWQAIENGSFAAAFGQPVEPASMRVFLARDRSRELAVKKVFGSGSSSPCSPGIALVELERELDVEPVPIRLEETAAASGALTLGGHCAAAGMLGSHRAELPIDALTDSSGAGNVPPRSMHSSAGTLATDIGGGLFDSETGALVGLVASGLGSGCDEDPLPETISTRLAAFRSMLLQVAADERITLHAEWDARTGPDPASACAGR